MSEAIVISNRSQLEAFEARAGIERANCRIYCDNSAFYGELEARRVRFEKLDEFLIQDRWDAVNAWARGKAASWIRLSNEQAPGEPNFAEIVFLEFGYILAQTVKNLLLARAVFERSAPQCVYLFEPPGLRRFPQFSGNAFLNHFLRETAQSRGVRCETLRLDSAEHLEPSGFDARSPLSRRAVKIAKRALKTACRFATRIPRRVDVLAYGSLRHLARVIDASRERRLSVAVYDFDLHMDQFRFAAARGIPYLFADLFVPSDPSAVRDFSAALKRRLDKLMSVSRERRFFSFEDTDLTGFVGSHVFNAIEGFLGELAYEHAAYNNLLSRLKPRTVLVDEDFGRRAYFASFMTARGIRCCCISHANFAVDFKIGPENRVFGRSLTVAQSEFEKDMYAARGWDPARITVMGAPRYDDWVPRVSAPPVSRKGSAHRYQLLCVAAALYPHTPDTYGYLGCHVYNQGELQRLFLSTVLQAIEGLAVQLVIKPHDVEDERLWRELAAASPASAQAVTVRSSDDFAGLMLACDALVLSAWSNTMIEAAIAGKPVLYLDLPPQKGPVLSLWRRHGYCDIFTDVASLRAELKKRLDPGYRPTPRAAREQDAYFLGPVDARSTTRVVDAIEKIRSER